MNLLPFAQLLESAGLGTQGTSIFAYQMPPESLKALMVRNDMAAAKLDYELPGYIKTRFQLIARATNYPDGDALITAAIKALTLAPETDLGGMRFNFCRPQTLPASFPLSKANLIEFSVMFEVCFVMEPA